jgi:hypothetical protein
MSAHYEPPLLQIPDIDDFKHCLHNWRVFVEMHHTKELVPYDRRTELFCIEVEKQDKNIYVAL